MSKKEVIKLDAKVQAELVHELEQLVKKAREGDIVAFFACGVHADKDMWGSVMVPMEVSGDLMNRAIGMVLDRVADATSEGGEA